MSIACIYHDHCWDGIGAAWIVKDYYTKYGESIDFYPGIYQQEPDYDALSSYHKIYVVDFCYPPEVLDKLALASTVIILDHHESAIKMLAGYQNPEVEVIFNVDNTQSGIGVTWEHFYSGAFVLPMALAYIQDRDIWAWKLRETKNFTAALQQYPITMASMDTIMLNIKHQSILGIIQEGVAINAVLASQIEKVLHGSYTLDFWGYKDIPFVNAPAYLMSEALNELAKGKPFAVGWYFDGAKEQLKFSLRSSKEGANVSEIAASFGGGGHAHAAGFVAENSDVLSLPVEVFNWSEELSNG